MATADGVRSGWGEEGGGVETAESIWLSVSEAIAKRRDTLLRERVQTATVL
ncbi:MAG: hypothetical protein KC421_03775 [Anaerolineales bacterium]|nr:hypothetical protein [Anaerolineales bacterium]